MDVLIDTNILVRRISRHDPQYRDARDALKAIEARGDRICVAPQNIIEFWNVATRPADRNGLSLTPEVANPVAGRIEESFHMLTEPIDVYREWRKLVVLHSVSGLRVYDARLVAVSIVHGLKTLVTFNVADFRRYAGIEILHPTRAGQRLKPFDVETSRVDKASLPVQAIANLAWVRWRYFSRRPCQSPGINREVERC